MKKTKSTIPNKSVFKDRKREADYWEKHFDRAWSDSKSINVKFARNLSETLNIRLDMETLNDVRNQARKKGLGPTQLIRMWIMEKIDGKHLQTMGV
ncbi:hypothetical protein HY030_02040 [Candidatus Gottesmanbacteria bacterium]|nr:hypothetical protein [Candidatus Gottesmanbacteria bacterium]